MRTRPTPLGELAEALGRAVEGDASFVVRGVASLEGAGPGDLVFVRSAGFAAKLADSRAGAVVASPELATGGRPTLRSPRPEYDWARALRRLVARERQPAGIHPTAVVAEDARVDPAASVGPHCVIGARCVVGPRTEIHPRCVLYEDVKVGADSLLRAGVVVREDCRIGDRVVIEPGAVIGSEGFGWAFDEAGSPMRILQLGRVVIEDDAEIGANATIQRATLDETRIRRNAKIDGLCVISHNCDVGEDVLMVSQSGLAGSTVLGRRVFMMGQTATAGHQRIGDGSFLGGRAAVVGDTPPGSRLWGVPAVPERTWHRQIAALARLPEALRRLRAVERKLGIRPGRKAEAPDAPEGSPS